MREAIVLLAIVFFGALPVPGTTISTPAIQDVHFSPPAVPTDLVIPPKVLSHPPAVYIDEARRRSIEGSVIVQAQFDEYGSATVLKVIKGLGYGLDEAALQALKGWRFSPALQNGLPVTAVAEIEVPFRLYDRERRIEELKRRVEEVRQNLQSLNAGNLIAFDPATGNILWLEGAGDEQKTGHPATGSDEIGRLRDLLLQAAPYR
jgi:TonB family protein